MIEPRDGSSACAPARPFKSAVIANSAALALIVYEYFRYAQLTRHGSKDGRRVNRLMAAVPGSARGACCVRARKGDAGRFDPWSRPVVPFARPHEPSPMPRARGLSG